MARVIKAWFNTIDLLKNKEQISNHALNSKIFRVKKQYFLTWYGLYRERALKRKRLADLEQFRVDNFAKRYWKPWVNEAKRRLDKRQ